jgi:hypothetical protein
VREGPRSVIIAVSDVKDAPMTEAAAAPQIEQFLLGQRNKAAAAAEMARLRSAAKIEYFNKTAGRQRARQPRQPLRRPSRRRRGQRCLGRQRCHGTRRGRPEVSHACAY